MTEPTPGPPPESKLPTSAGTTAPHADCDWASFEPAVVRLREKMECIVLPPRAGVAPSDRPAVEIFLGTEPAQYRANRVFVWSIEKVRDPSREVRIHLMSQLDDFDRRGWTTGFTNYRFAIPALLGGRGRAIYNDEDQIYLTDPGVLFDLDLGSTAHLSISDTESSVMLIDCERMASVWTLEDAKHAWKRSLLRKASKETGLRGDLDPGWNARDEEFVPGQSHLLHYTTLHTQPWRPFPERFVYQQGSHTQLWHDLEREAIEAGFEIFRCDAPSRGFVSWVERLQTLPRSELGSGVGVSGELAGAVDALVRQSKARQLIEIAPDLRGDVEQSPGRFGLESERRVGLLEWLAALDADERFDGVVCVDGLEALPIWDIPWIVDSLFEKAGGFVFVAVRCPEKPPRRRFLLPPQGTPHTPDWWRSHFEAASVRHPHVGWQLMTTRGTAFDGDRVHVAQGGPRLDATPPRVWTLTDGAPGNETQVRALAAELGWPCEHRAPELGGFASLPFASRGAHLRGLREGTRERAALAPPWPDLLIVAGRRVAPVARWIRTASSGRTRVVALGGKAATPAESVDLAVTSQGIALFPHPNRLEVDRPLVRVGRATGPGVPSSSWRDRVAAIKGPRIALLLGSGTERLGLDRRAAEALGRLVADSAVGLGASVLISASQHTRPDVFEGCVRGVGRAALVHHATRDQQPDERAWPVILEEADLFVMAGLGATALAEICATGKPVFLSPQLRAAPTLWARMRDGFVAAVARRAEARPENDRGTTRPQEGLELICAKSIAQGWIRPKRDIEALRGRLVRSGHARLLRAPIRAGDLDGFAGGLESEVASVADRIRAMLGTAPVPEEETRE